MAYLIAVGGLLAAICLAPVRPLAQTPVSGSEPDSIEIRTDLCRSCRITLEQVNRIDSSIHSELGPSASLAVTSTGRLLVASFGSGGEVVQLSREGTFERKISGDGVGPGELTAVTDIAIGRRDTIYLIDGVRRWLHRVNAEGRFIDRTLLPGGIHRVLPIGGRRLFASATVPSRGAVGYPLHIIDAEGIVRSFGDEGDVSGARDGAMIRYLARGNGDTVWVGNRLSYQLEAWSVDGERRAVLTRTVDWFRESRTPPATSPQLVPRQTTMRGLFHDDGVLWVFISVADSNWKPRPLKPSPVPNMYAPDRVLDPYLDTIIEVIDLKRRVVIAYVRDDRSLVPVSGGLLTSYAEDANGRAVYKIIRPTLTGSKLSQGGLP